MININRLIFLDYNLICVNNLLKIKYYEIYDLIYEEKFQKGQPKEGLQEKIDITKLSTEDSSFNLMEEGSLNYGAPKSILDSEKFCQKSKFFIISKKYQFMVILVLEKNDKKEEVMNSWKNEIFAFFVSLLQEIRNNYFQELKNKFINEIVKMNETTEIKKIILNFFNSVFKENFSLRIQVLNEKSKRILIDEKTESQKNTAEFLNEGKIFNSN